MLVLDEAQQYPAGALEEIRLLLGLNFSCPPAFALVLLGDLYLQDTLRLQHHRALYSRVALRCQLPGLERAQVELYLTHSLRQVGLERPCLSPAAVDLLASASNGNVRLLNLLARAAWLGEEARAYWQTKQTLSSSPSRLVPRRKGTAKGLRPLQDVGDDQG